MDDRKRRSAQSVDKSKIKNMTQPKHSDRAMAAALAELKGTNPRTAAMLMFFAAARTLRVAIGSRRAAALAYKIADEFAVKDK